MRRPEHCLSVRGLILPSIRDLGRHLGSFTAYGILFFFFNSLLLTPAFTFLFALLIRSRGDRVVTNDEILGFFLSPIGAGAILLVFLAVFTTVMTQQAGLVIIYASLRGSRPVGSLRALLAMVLKIPGMLLINGIRAVLLLLILLPFAAIAAVVYLRFLSGYDLNYLVQVRPPAFWWAAAGGGVLAVVAVLCVLTVHTRVFFAPPAYFFGGFSPLAALRQSALLARGYTGPLVRLFLIWIVAVGALNLLLGSVLERLGPAVLPLAGTRLEVVVAVIALVLTVQGLAHAALNVFTFGVNAIGVARAYLFVTSEDSLDIPEASLAVDPRRRRLGWTAATLACLVLVGAGATAFGLLEQGDLRDSVSVAAHRGSSRAAPENTLAAIERAVEDGADFAEIDVQETADGEIVVIHDTDLRRIAGLEGKIWEVTYEEIRHLDAGSWFSPDFAGERIPTLDEAIALADGRIGLNIEIKLTGHERGLVQGVARLIEESGFETQCIVTSMNRPVLAEVRRLNPRLKIGYIVYEMMGDIARVDADAVMLKASKITPLGVLALHDAGMEVHAWTVNDPLRMSYLIDRGVDGILTDYPGTLREVLRQRAALTDIQRLVLRFGELAAR